jgi:hypothetical protein
MSEYYKLRPVDNNNAPPLSRHDFNLLQDAFVKEYAERTPIKDEDDRDAKTRIWVRIVWDWLQQKNRKEEL